MRLRINTPLSLVVDADAVQIVSAEDASGAFAVQPRHADFLTRLSIGVVSWKDSHGKRCYCAVHGGVLTVTRGQEVVITTLEAILGDDIATLDQVILDRFGSDATAERVDRLDSTKLQLRAIRAITRYRQPGMLS